MNCATASAATAHHRHPRHDHRTARQMSRPLLPRTTSTVGLHDCQAVTVVGVYTPVNPHAAVARAWNGLPRTASPVLATCTGYPLAMHRHAKRITSVIGFGRSW